ncbi:MAG TPA: TonB C-terminal domain-containing protein [Candidatus Obscuribacter sp.]|nr:TonB C-terminal domain-containing protein [Candidatus Obscuribacter sp.]
MGTDFMISSIMKNPRYTIIARLGALLVLAASLPTAVWAQEAAVKRPVPFKLNAQVNHNPQLSRDAGDMLLSHLSPVNPQESSGLLPSGTPAQTKAPTATGFSPNSQLSARIAAESQQSPQAYLSEYDVDWSGWISQMAARWHYNLRRLEAQSNICFVTERPALIQFTCASNGQVGNFSLKQSSGIYAYDQLQMLALSQVTPLPPFPKGTRCATITLVQGWESHAKKPGENGFDPRAFGRRFPMEKVQQWVRSN